MIVSYNVQELLIECLQSIAENPASIPAQSSPRRAAKQVEVIVVDSASTDGTAEAIRNQFPWVRLIEPGQNVGFSKGNNIGIEAASGDHILLLNPDTLIVDSAVALLSDYLDSHPAVGVVGPQLLNQDGTVQSSRRRFPTLSTALFESTWLQPMAPRSILRAYYVQDHADGETVDVDWVTGAALMVRREVIEQVGGLDEGFFMYSEELDWQRRIKQAGWKIAYYPEAQVIHYGGKSSEQVIGRRHVAFQNSKIRYFRKHHGSGIALALRIFLLANYTVQLVLEGAKGMVGHKRALRAERVQAYWQVLRSGLKGT